MERWQVITAIVLGYLVITLMIGLLAGRRTTAGVTGYVAADRQFGVLTMYFVVGGTIFSAFAFLGGPGWAYSRGAAAFYILSYGVLGIAPWYYLAPRAARIGRRNGYVTQAQLVVGRFPHRGLSALFALLTVAAFIPYLMLQMSGAGIVFSAVTEQHVPFWAGAALAYGVVTAYVLFGGAAAVGWTNVFEGLIMMVVAWGIGIYLPEQLYGGVTPMFERIAAERPELLTMPGLAANGEPWSWGAYSTAILSSALGFAMWPHLFMKALLNEERKVIGRMDGRITGIDTDPISDTPNFDPALSGYTGVYTGAFNNFIRNRLNFKSDLPYEALSGRVGPWQGTPEVSRNYSGGYLNVADDLRDALVSVPSMKVLVASGHYDLATPYFAADYTVEQMRLPPELRDNIEQTYYGGGHMMYHVIEEQAKLHEDVSAFIRGATPTTQPVE